MTPRLSSLRHPRRRWLALLVLILFLFSSAPLLIYSLTQTTVTLDVSGHVRRLHTRAQTVGELLDEADVLIDPEDVVHPEPAARLHNGMTVTVRKAFIVAVEADEVVRHVRTQFKNPLDILEEQAISITSADRVEVDGHDLSPDVLARRVWETPPAHIRLHRSVTVTINDGGEARVIQTTQPDVGRALDEAGVKLYLADRVTPGFSTPVRDGLTVTIERSMPVQIAVDGRRLHTRSRGPTVGDALAEIGVAPIGLDTTIPPLEAPLSPGMTIRVIRVTEKVLTEQVPIPVSTLYRLDPALPLGQGRIVQAGVPGLVEWQVRVRFEDMREVRRDVVNEVIVRPATPREVVIGTGLPF